MATDETTALLPSNASGSGSSYYFLHSESSQGERSIRDADGGEVIERLPQGVSDDTEFAPRLVDQKVRFNI
jgi:hypothetical protein